MSLSANVERGRVRDWIAELRLGGQGGSRLLFAGNCAAPVELFVRGLPDRFLVERKRERDRNLVAWIETPCRKCDACLTHRAQLWGARAVDELRLATRTWFATLTLAPEQATRAIFAGQRWLAERGHALSEVSESEQFSATVHAVSPEITRWLKRIRKNSGARLRYLLVCEAHKSGVPHWHALVHEYDGKVTARKLEASWRYGISHFRLVDGQDKRTAFYVAKYLGKSALTRVRASKHYGSPTVDHFTNQLEELIKIIGTQTNISSKSL